MKKQKIKVNKIQYTDKCPVCKLKIIGTSESQVKYNLKVHCMQRHNITLEDAKLEVKKDANKKRI